VFLLNKEGPAIFLPERYPVNCLSCPHTVSTAELYVWIQWQGITWTAEKFWLLREGLTGSKFLCTWCWVCPILPWCGVPLGRWCKRLPPFVECSCKCSGQAVVGSHQLVFILCGGGM